LVPILGAAIAPTPLTTLAIARSLLRLLFSPAASGGSTKVCLVPHLTQ
jgi:hypothetical protein